MTSFCSWKCIFTFQTSWMRSRRLLVCLWMYSLRSDMLKISGVQPAVFFAWQIQAICHYGDLRLKSDRANIYVTTYPLPHSSDSRHHCTYLLLRNVYAVLNASCVTFTVYYFWNKSLTVRNTAEASRQKFIYLFELRSWLKCIRVLKYGDDNMSSTTTRHLKCTDECLWKG